jgi:RHS repeat-associated protein
MLIDLNQGIVAKYLYDAFGNTISKSGLLSDANVYRFSSKEWQQNSGLAYYLYRYYVPNLQRWPNKAEASFGVLNPLGINLYGFIGNDPLDRFDPKGLKPLPIPGLPGFPFTDYPYSAGGKYNPPSCKLNNQCTTSAAVGPNATVCTYSCVPGGYDDEISSLPVTVTYTVAPGQPCPSYPPNAPTPLPPPPPSPPHHYGRG